MIETNVFCRMCGNCHNKAHKINLALVMGPHSTKMFLLDEIGVEYVITEGALRTSTCDRIPRN